MNDKDILKELEVMELHTGDTIKLTNGDIMEFVRLKRTKFIASMKGQNFDVPIQMYDSLVEKVDLKKKENEKSDILKSLKIGEYFYINKGGNAIVFKFDGIEGNKIIGVNPINNCKTKIDISFEVGKLI
ncbi:hypothetical protein [Clostridium sp. ZBS18]|uniref:hypothetical protein n=1 Tax=Clostridium sp. ZBS18 TaxID=2949967 RepID=UPI00207A4E12|nr:hypothetical protein [Clostridium sp. ZBS18]